MSEREIRDFLEDYIARITARKEPLPPASQASLLDFLNEHDAGMQRILAELARAQLRLAKSMRPLSSEAAQRTVYQQEVERLRRLRSETIARAPKSTEFQEYFSLRTAHYEQRLIEWKSNMELAQVAQSILAQEVIPGIMIEQKDPSIIIDSVKSMKIDPEPGDLLFHFPEPYMHFPQFSSQRNLGDRLDPIIWGQKVPLLISASHDDAAEAIAAGAKVVRDRMYMHLDESGVPLGDVDWGALTPFLPLAARPRFRPILPDLIPESSWGASLKNLLTKPSWESLRQASFEKHGGACILCGFERFLACHELWEYQEPFGHEKSAFGLQKLVDIVPLCEACHDVYHIGYAVMKEREKAVLHRWKGLNRWDTDEFRFGFNLMADRWRRRNTYSWALDLSFVSGTTLFLNKNWSLREDGWLASSTKKSLTRLYGCTWRQNDKYFSEDLPRLTLVPWGWTPPARVETDASAGDDMMVIHPAGDVGEILVPGSVSIVLDPVIDEVFGDDDPDSQRDEDLYIPVTAFNVTDLMPVPDETSSETDIGAPTGPEDPL